VNASWSKVWTILHREYLIRVRNKWFLITTLGLPVLVVGISLIPYWLSGLSDAEVGSLRLGVIADGRVGIADLRAVLREEGLEVELRELRELSASAPRRELADRLATSGESDAYLVIRIEPEPDHESPAPPARRQAPTDGEAAVGEAGEAAVAGEGDVYLLSRTGVSLSRRITLERAVRRALLRAGLRDAGVGKPARDELVRRAAVELEVMRVAAGSEGSSMQSQELLSQLALGFIFALYMMFLVYGQIISRSVVEEKTSDIVEVLISSVRPFELMMGKILGIGAVGLTQIGVWVGVAAIAALYGGAGVAAGLAASGIDPAQLDFPYLETGSAFLTYFLLGFVLYATEFAAVGAIVGDESQVQQVSLPVILSLVVPFLMAVAAVGDMEAGWVLPASLFPFFSPILMVVRVSMGVAAAWEIVTSVVLLVATILGMTWLVGRIFRVGILMKGKSPNLPELVRWIRYG